MKSYYNGYKVLPNNSKAVKYCRLLKKSRVIEYNPQFFSRITPEQVDFMLEWCVRSRFIKDPFACDTRTLAWFTRKGYSPDIIADLYSSMQFASKHHRDARIQNLYGLKPTYKIAYILGDLRLSLVNYYRLVLRSWKAQLN